MKAHSKLFVSQNKKQNTTFSIVGVVVCLLWWVSCALMLISSLSFAIGVLTYSYKGIGGLPGDIPRDFLDWNTVKSNRNQHTVKSNNQVMPESSLASRATSPASSELFDHKTNAFVTLCLIGFPIRFLMHNHIVITKPCFLKNSDFAAVVPGFDHSESNIPKINTQCNHTIQFCAKVHRLPGPDPRHPQSFKMMQPMCLDMLSHLVCRTTPANIFSR